MNKQNKLSDENMTISENLKTLRTKKGFTQGKLSEKANVELAQISRIERGTVQPKLETIKKLSLALNCSSDELIFDNKSEDGDEKLKRLINGVCKMPEEKKQIAIELLEALIMKSEAENWINSSD
ncbi:transcriptional repressor DicA [Pseudoalteromonas sp. P1-9]|uniref:helix-turn-helix domain-containing protein n=1 Tax=Pseudoalteromonas sp. P1-9 TaxID=1710354 RepID=UPI0006D5E70A|nr:helix-turn-helix transcriptional regulator [Pseudoalteromonas sp. P1-9]KPV93620.1 transcriptional repressor DicA [Pseudoalteromonas sp. P1-9]